MSIEFIKTNTPEPGINALTLEIIDHLTNGEKVLWLVPGGSNIPISVAVMKKVAQAATVTMLNNLSIALTDERYGPLGHADSNWKQLYDAGFTHTGPKTQVLHENITLEDTVKRYSEDIENLFSSHDHIVGQFGIGEDGHIAGVLPGTIGVASTDRVVGYQSEKFTRISLTLSALARIHSAYAFVFGESKKKVIEKLHQEVALDEMPSQILKKIPKPIAYTDQ
jgi:6-phosphogluconolactonase/glucosamine-6-phosphate isomerase/deaminase